MKDEPREPLVHGALSLAKEKLARALPPQPDKILRALQYVELALHYSEIEDRTRDVLEDSRNALRAINLIDKPRELPPRIAVAVSTARDEIVKAVRALERATAVEIRCSTYQGPDRRKHDSLDDNPDIPRRRSDDTLDLFACNADVLFEAHTWSNDR